VAGCSEYSNVPLGTMNDYHVSLGTMNISNSRPLFYTLGTIYVKYTTMLNIHTIIGYHNIIFAIYHGSGSLLMHKVSNIF